MRAASILLVIPSAARNLYLKSRFVVIAMTLIALTAVPLIARSARHGDRDTAALRPIVPDDTTSLMRLLRSVRAADPLLCEMAVRNADMHGWWSNWGPISGDPLELDSASAATIRWIQNEHNDPRLVAPLTAALRDPDGCVRRLAGSFLGRVQHPSARAALVSALDDANASTRASAAIGLGLGEHRAAVQSLIARLRDSDAAVRRASAWALGAIEDKGAVEALVLTLQRDADPRVRQTAAWALGSTAK